MLRWRIAVLVSAAIAISYLDRQTLPVAIHAIQKDIPLSNQQFSYLQSSFLVAYAFMYAAGGKLIDALGSRRGFTLIMVAWSLACLSHGIATSFGMLAVSRFLLGAGEGGGFPAAMAEEATLDVLTGGNYILGIGLGYRQPEFDAFGISLAERAPRFNEAIALMRRLWTEDRVSHQGRFYTVNDAGIGVKPVRPGGPPIYIAGQADVSVRRAARIGDAWLIVNSSGLGKLAPLMQTYRAALKEYGRTPMEFPITVECYVGARHATAHEECRGPLEYKYGAYAAWGMEDRTSVSFEDFARDRFIIGDKSSVKEEIARYRELLGVDHFIMRCQWPGLPQEQALGSIRRLGEIFAS